MISPSDLLFSMDSLIFSKISQIDLIKNINFFNYTFCFKREKVIYQQARFWFLLVCRKFSGEKIEKISYLLVNSRKIRIFQFYYVRKLLKISIFHEKIFKNFSVTFLLNPIRDSPWPNLEPLKNFLHMLLIRGNPVNPFILAF